MRSGVVRRGFGGQLCSCDVVHSIGAVGQLPWYQPYFTLVFWRNNMASIRTARVIAAVSALPLAAARSLEGAAWL